MDPRVGLSRDGTGLLVMVKITVKSRLVSKPVIQVHCAAARYHKRVGDALVYQLLGNIIRNLHSHK